jgi:hypothetical protein
VPGQVVAVTQPTHAPAPLQTLVPPVPHDAPEERGGFVGVVPVQTSSVQSLPSTGRSVAFATCAIPPAPSPT